MLQDCKYLSFFPHKQLQYIMTDDWECVLKTWNRLFNSNSHWIATLVKSWNSWLLLRCCSSSSFLRLSCPSCLCPPPTPAPPGSGRRRRRAGSKEGWADFRLTTLEGDLIEKKHTLTWLNLDQRKVLTLFSCQKARLVSRIWNLCPLSLHEITCISLSGDRNTNFVYQRDLK